MSPHDRPNERPVHPECAALDGGLCSCGLLWGFWNGSQDALDDMTQTATRLDMRTKHGVHSSRGCGPDSYEPAQAGDSLAPDLESAEGIAGYESSELELAGFWKESEFLEGFERE